ncbi:MAG: phosphatidylglycerol:prolipoprotein diacylglycerol transferase [Planctomycetota bacterium]|jgi:phosphatidylglycerol:prolipoprotein diacylglycerol transferase
MYPHLFGLRFPPTFGLLVVLGFLFGTHIHAKLVNESATDREREGYAALPVWVLLGIMSGARMMYVLVEILRDSPVGQNYLAKPWEMLFYWEGGLVMYGGAFGAIAAAMLCIKKYGLPMAYTLDTGAISCYAGLGIGRIGCLMVGDDFGQIVPSNLDSLPFPLTIQVPDPLPEGSLFGVENAGRILWNTQIWMSVNAFMIAKIGHWVFTKRRYAGQSALTMFVMYSVMRSLIESKRGDSVRGLWFDGALSTSQVISIGFGLICLVLLLVNKGRRDEPQAAQEEAAPSEAS